MRESITAQCSAPPSEPANGAFLRIRARGLCLSLDDGRVEIDNNAVEGQAQSLAARQRVAERFGELGLLADELKLHAQPGFEGFERRPAALLAANRAALPGGVAPNLSLDPIECCDAHQRLGSDRRGSRSGQLVEVPAHVAPAEGEPYVALLGQHLVAAIAIHPSASLGSRGVAPSRRATTDTTVPASSVSDTIRALSSIVQRRRPTASVMTSMCRTGLLGSSVGSSLDPSRPPFSSRNSKIADHQHPRKTASEHCLWLMGAIVR